MTTFKKIIRDLIRFLNKEYSTIKNRYYFDLRFDTIVIMERKKFIDESVWELANLNDLCEIIIDENYNERFKNIFEDSIEEFLYIECCKCERRTNLEYTDDYFRKKDGIYCESCYEEVVDNTDN